MAYTRSHLAPSTNGSGTGTDLGKKPQPVVNGTFPGKLPRVYNVQWGRALESLQSTGVASITPKKREPSTRAPNPPRTTKAVLFGEEEGPSPPLAQRERGLAPQAPGWWPGSLLTTGGSGAPLPKARPGKAHRSELPRHPALSDAPIRTPSSRKTRGRGGGGGGGWREGPTPPTSVSRPTCTWSGTELGLATAYRNNRCRPGEHPKCPRPAQGLSS
jgi:hypothetical protein